MSVILRIIQYVFLIFFFLGIAGQVHEWWIGAEKLTGIIGPLLFCFIFLGISSWARDKANAKAAREALKAEREAQIDALLARDVNPKP